MICPYGCGADIADEVEHTQGDDCVALVAAFGCVTAAGRAAEPADAAARSARATASRKADNCGHSANYRAAHLAEVRERDVERGQDEQRRAANRLAGRIYRNRHREAYNARARAKYRTQRSAAAGPLRG